MRKSSWLIFLSVILIDQLSKALAVRQIIRAEVTTNPGLPFVGEVAPGFFGFGLVLVLLIAFVFLYRKYFDRNYDAGFALILAGAVSNLIDRAGDGAVTDFVDLGLGGRFNLADAAVWLGIVVLLLKTAKKSEIRNNT